MKCCILLFGFLFLTACKAHPPIYDGGSVDSLEVASPSPMASGSTACLPNTVSFSSLVGACGVPVSYLPGLLSGGPYISLTDPASVMYDTNLYPGSNEPPSLHSARGDSIAQVLSGGPIKVACFGMSNSKLIFDDLIARLGTSVLDNPQVSVVDFAESGCDLTCWMSKSVASDAAVKVVFLYHSNNKPQSSGCDQLKRFPTHALNTQAQLENFLVKIRSAYPNLKQVFISSREFGGWGCAPSSTKYTEPVAFEEGFSVKWFVEAHLNEVSPWIGWGPYTWDSATKRENFRKDGVHPCAVIGVPVFSGRWFDFLLNNSSTRPWFAANP